MTSPRLHAVLGSMLLLTAACGGDDPAPRTPAAGAGGGDAPAADAGSATTPADDTPRTVDPATAGSMRGVVRVSGSVPAREPLPIVGEAFCIDHHEQSPMLSEKLVVAGDKLVNAFVWIESGLEDYAFEDPTEKVVLDQKGCMYTPHVIGVQTGQTIEVLNSDPVMHNVHTKPDQNKPKNFGMPQGSTPRELDFRRAEVMVETVCDVHAWMKGYIGVVDHPFFAVTDADGAFSFDGVPPGQYTVGVWHESLGTKRVEVTLDESASVTLDDVVFAL